VLTSSFAFSWMSILTSLAGTGCPWQIIALVRSLVPLVLVAVWVKLDGVRLVFWGSRILWVRSIAGSCSLVGSFYALTHMHPSEVATISNIFPIWVALLSWPMLGEVPSPVVWLSALTGVVGVFLVQMPYADGLNPTALVVVAVSFLTALAMMGLHQLKELDPRTVVVHFSGVSTAFCLAALALLPLDPPPEPLELHHLLLLGAVGVTATVGQLFLTLAFTSGVPSRVSVVALTQVVFVLVLDVALLGLRPEPVKLLGVVLILAPTAWIMLRKTRRVRPVIPSPPGDKRSLQPTVSCKG
jgi:drug/metabolite transporter (DMT)-like permease